MTATHTTPEVLAALDELRALIAEPCTCRPARICRRCEVCYPKCYAPPSPWRAAACEAITLHNRGRAR